MRSSVFLLLAIPMLLACGAAAATPSCSISTASCQADEGAAGGAAGIAIDESGVHVVGAAPGGSSAFLHVTVAKDASSAQSTGRAFAGASTQGIALTNPADPSDNINTSESNVKGGAAVAPDGTISDGASSDPIVISALGNGATIPGARAP